MHFRRKHDAASERTADRRRREDESPRLAAEIPNLVNLRLEVEERSTSTTVGQPKHVRRIVVGSAPALFLVPCGDPQCTDGGHDVTREVMRALRSGETSFQGDDECSGSLRQSPCTRTMHYEAVAEYR